MHPLRTHIPSANALFTFEAAARRRSFTAAADELNVSQPAVSKMIRQFEASLGFKLFHRDTRPLELTAEGKRLFADVERSFDLLNSSILAMRQGERRDTVRVSFSASFLQLWLLPRLSDFTETHPGVDLAILESSHDDIDLYAEGIEVSARLGHGNWPDLNAQELVPEVIFPVAHPGFIAKTGGQIGDLGRARLLHFRERHRVRFGWRDWLSASGGLGGRVEEAVVFSDALGSLGAASLGHGVALGWSHLVLDQVLAGNLQQVGSRRLATGNSVWLVTSRRRSPSPAAEAFLRWVLRRMGQDCAAHPGIFLPQDNMNS
ncbi:LysR family transcriptional regulator [Frigidibacter albus]|uniref:LysR family transcriptional regulator n=1 Tax=Frigidibacter albus TaxID=1465486 RepID=A0A6L8VG07_9RHOB|nr:LysR substrate-binding domain-containing protein [Frigidibacter albus]MZQ89193.1 LysR family transcriptional regulator [Frigidibacter albus]NBE30750.1 LysR family transcriptional regulator [Frigidibacter albus]GGH50842.1 LysR family transcriptional regulator [Frigidibacter albus]